MKLLEINPRFIEDHIEELIKIEDYVPISFKSYGAQDKRADFLNSKKLLQTIMEMHELVRQKCNHAEDSVKAYNSVLIEWLGCHPQFEYILDKDSFVQYQNIKNNDDFTGCFINLLHDVKLPSEKKSWVPSNEGIRDDSSIQLPNFKKKDEIFDEYGATLLACYLSYLV